jgi:hypothetical protein
VLAHLVDVLVPVPVSATIVLIFRPTLKLISHALDDKDR